MDKETLHRILVHPTRTGLDKVEKEITRLNGVNDVLRQELQTWKDAVAARNETIKLNNKDTAELQHQVDTLNESIELNMKHSKRLRHDNALQVERLRIHVQTTHSCVDDLTIHLHKLNGSLKKLEDEAWAVRNSIAGDVEIDWTEELSRESDDTDTE